MDVRGVNLDCDEGKLLQELKEMRARGWYPCKWRPFTRVDARVNLGGDL